MEVKPGYKHTEVGVIPDDWEVKQLRHISPSQSVGLVINPSSYFDDAGAVPILVGSNVKENGINWESARRISDASNHVLTSSRLEAGDLVTVRVGEPGVTAVIPPELDGCNCASMMIVRRHVSFNSHWLCYMMNSRIGRTQVKNVQYGTAQKQFNISDAINFAYPAPPLAEQEAIAEALNDADAHIESLEQLLVKKRQIKQGAMQELLTGKRRLPGFQTKPGYKQTEVGMIPADWEFMPFRRAVAIYIDYRGRTPRKLGLSWGSGDILALSANNVQMGRIDPDKEAYLGSEVLYRKWMVQGNCEKGDILLTMEAPLGNVAQIPDSRRYILSQRVLLIKPKDWILPDFLANYMRGALFQNQLSQNSTGSTAKGIQRAKLDDLQIFLPSTKAEQEGIATILSDMDAEIAALEAKLTKARQLKQGMMQELLTGRIRLI